MYAYTITVLVILAATANAQPLPTGFEKHTIFRKDADAPADERSYVRLDRTRGNALVLGQLNRNRSASIERYYWTDQTGVVPIPRFGGYAQMQITTNSSASMFVGYCMTKFFNDPSPVAYREEAVSWIPGGATQSVFASSGTGEGDNRLIAVNDKGESIGSRMIGGGETQTIFRRPNGSLVVVPGMFLPQDINNSGEVIGLRITGSDTAGFATLTLAIWKEGQLQSTLIGPPNVVIQRARITDAGDVVVQYQDSSVPGGGNHDVKIALIHASDRGAYEILGVTRTNNFVSDIQVTNLGHIVFQETIIGAGPQQPIYKYFNWKTGFYREFDLPQSQLVPVLGPDGLVIWNNNDYEWYPENIWQTTTRFSLFTIWREGYPDRKVRAVGDPWTLAQPSVWRSHVPSGILSDGRVVVVSSEPISYPNGLTEHVQTEINILTPTYGPIDPTPTPTPTPQPPAVPVPTPQPEPIPSALELTLASLQDRLIAARRVPNPAARANQIRNLNAQIARIQTAIRLEGASSDEIALAGLQDRLAAARRIPNPVARANQIRNLNAQIARLQETLNQP